LPGTKIPYSPAQSTDWSHIRYSKLANKIIITNLYDHATTKDLREKPGNKCLGL